LRYGGWGCMPYKRLLLAGVFSVLVRRYGVGVDDTSVVLLLEDL